MHYTHKMVEQVPWEDRIPVLWPTRPVPCTVTPRFADGYEGETRGEIVAWSPNAFEVRFRHPDSKVPLSVSYKVWIAAERVEVLPGVVWGGGTPDVAVD